MAPIQPPTPEYTATYCFPSGPMYVIGLPMTPDSKWVFQSYFPSFALTALKLPSIVP